MRQTTLASFIETALRDRRIRFGDVRRLERDALPDGVATHEQAEALLALDNVVDKADPAWSGFLARAIGAFLARQPADTDDRRDMTAFLARLSRTGRRMRPIAGERSPAPDAAPLRQFEPTGPSAPLPSPADDRAIGPS